jgi:DNA-binding NarL/FixJ family response regulator
VLRESTVGGPISSTSSATLIEPEIFSSHPSRHDNRRVFLESDMDTAHRNPSRPRILLADDHEIFAEMLRGYLDRTFTVIATVADGLAMLKQAVRLKPDVVVADVSMPLLNGLDAARRIREQTPKVKFVFLTMYADPNLAAAALELGRVSFVLKCCGGQEVLKAIEETLHGRSYVTARLRAEDWVAARKRARQFSKDLTERQYEFLRLYAEGRTHREIAEALNISKRTVEFHRSQIMDTFGLKSNADLILFALKKGLISVDPGPYALAS